ncbi:Cullin repeat-like-containing domain protein [Pterulicium gracile]|uniref:Exocyst complex protein EXO70 n=1 Tax=Pterulicium gracile TaxID=1884261 RepID=A0A5C3PZL2_9AGAR|nr:Cullin repeat-like-containing domain protein [Pterula gracilis]
MDDETAEIELLEQNLNKTRQISQRMTCTTFDTRLAKLEKSIYPLYTSTQVLNRRAFNIEQALVKIDQLASDQEGVAAEEALILRGPQTGQLGLYKDALERLNASIAFKSSDADSLETARLIETGAKKLTVLYTKLVAECSSGSTPGPTAALEPPPIPDDVLATLTPLVAFLRTLPQPSTHPSHPASASILSTLKEAQKGYADMRGNWVKRCLEGAGKRVMDRMDTVDVLVSGREFGAWVEALLDFAEEEYASLTALAPLSSSSLLSSTYHTLLTPLLSLFGTTLSTLITLIKRSLAKYTFLALSTYDALASLQPRFESRVLSRRTLPSSSRAGGNELREGLTSLRAICLRSFPETLADIKLASLSSPSSAAADGPGGEASTAVSDVTVQTVKYLERLPDVSGAVGTALIALGDGNWKMGEGVMAGMKGGAAGQQTKLGEGDEGVVIEHYTYDIIITLVTTLTTLSKSNTRRPSMGSVFLLNNITYIYTRVLSPSSALPSLLSTPTKDSLKSAFRTAKAGYFDANYSPLMAALSDSPSSDFGSDKKAGKERTKDKMTKFFDLLEEVVERHRLGARVLEEDEEERRVVGEEVVKLVVTSMRGFVGKYRDKELGKNPQKYIKMTPEAVEAQLRSIYR